MFDEQTWVPGNKRRKPRSHHDNEPGLKFSVELLIPFVCARGQLSK